MGMASRIILSRRSVLWASGVVLAGCASGADQSARPARVLFVCQFGSVKSAVAREHLRRLAATRRIAVSVQSRGITPEDHVSPVLLEALAAEGLNTRSEPLQALTAGDLAAADFIVVFDPLPSAFGALSVRDWSDVPSMNANYATARAVLMPRLAALLDEMERG